MDLTPDQIVDLVKLTQVNLIKRGAYLNLMTDLTDFVAVREMYKKHQKVFSGGLDWEFEAVIDHNHSARFVGLYENDGTAINDATIKGKVSPRFVDANYAFDVREKIFQRPAIEIVNYVKLKYERMLMSYWELLEPTLWSKPEDSNDKRTPYGVAYWITKGTDTDIQANKSGGFIGKDPVGFSEGRAGISTTTTPRWANWAAGYAEVSKEDLVRKMRRAVRKTQFRSPISVKEPDVGTTGNGIYTNDNVLHLLEEILEAQNMNLGNDIASKDGKVVFKGHPVVYAPYLDEDTTDPVYMLDWKTLALGMMDGWQQHVSAPQVVAGKHNVRAVFLDAGVNMICTNLRKNAVFHKVDASLLK